MSVLLDKEKNDCTATLGLYEQKQIENASVQLVDSKGNTVSEGDEVDDDETVTVTITPKNGFYVTGKNVRDDVYSQKNEIL